jgi:uncharacterized protein YuzE
MMMRLKYDLNAGALYIKLSDQAVVRTRDIDDNTSVDLDSAGGVVGIEVISIAHPWALDAILSSYSIPPADKAQLCAYFGRTGLGLPREAPALSIGRNEPVCVPA